MSSSPIDPVDAEIHANIAQRCLGILEDIRTKGVWRRGSPLPSVVVAWPETPVTSIEGITVSGHITFPFTEPVTPTVLAEVRRVTRAFATLTVEDGDDGLHARLESRAGRRDWHMPAREVPGLGWILSRTVERPLPS